MEEQKRSPGAIKELDARPLPITLPVSICDCLRRSQGGYRSERIAWALLHDPEFVSDLGESEAERLIQIIEKRRARRTPKKQN